MNINNVNIHDTSNEGVYRDSSFTSPAQTLLHVTHSLFQHNSSVAIKVIFNSSAANATAMANQISITNNQFQFDTLGAGSLYGIVGAVIQNNNLVQSGGGFGINVSTGIQANNNAFFHMKASATIKSSLIQFKGVFRASNSISCNTGLQDYPNTVNSTDNVNDPLSLYDPSGVPTSPIHMVGNKLLGGGPWVNGSAIIAADGDQGSSYVNITDNVLVSATQGGGGVGLAGGQHIVVKNNQVVNTLAVGATWSPLFLLKFTLPTVLCQNISYINNTSNWISHTDESQLASATIWLSDSNGTCNNVTSVPIGYSTRVPSLDATIYDTYTPHECPIASSIKQ